MTPTQIFKHQDYDLACSARPVDNGRFEPTLMVSRQAWPSRPRVIAVERGAHVTPDAAIEAARTTGIEWVQNYG